MLKLWSLILLAMALPAAAQAQTVTSDVLSCDYPVKASDTAKSLLARYKGAKIDDVYIADILVTGVRLFPDEGGREIDVTFSDDQMTHVQFVMTGDSSTWHGPDRLHFGSPLADVVAANQGQPLTINGFDWDYGGWIEDTHGGPLNSLAGKGCFFGIQLDITSQTLGDEADKISGDNVTVSSTDPLVIKARPVISEMSLTFAAPKP